MDTTRACTLSMAILTIASPSISIASDSSESSATEETSSSSAFVFGADDYVLFPDGDRVLLAGNKDLLVEAQVATDIRVASNLYDTAKDVLTPHEGNDCPHNDKPPAQRKCFKRRWGRSAFGTIMLRLRMFDQPSNPVRTPSFMPKGTVQVVGFKSLIDPDDADDERYVGSDVSVVAISVVAGHHSNGQDGCLFRVTDAQECGSIVSRRREINTDNGSFSTNYFRVGAHFGRMTIGDDYFTVTKDRGLGIALEHHLHNFLPGWLEEPLRSLYGTTRLKANARYARANVWKLRRFEVRLGYEYIADLPQMQGATSNNGKCTCGNRHVFSAEAFMHPESWDGIGYYTRFYQGRDYYNIAFEERIRRVEVGVAFNGAKFFDFQAPSQ